MTACACEHCGHEFESDPGGGHRLLCGDATSADDVARLMGGEQADICFTSPPFGNRLLPPPDRGQQQLVPVIHHHLGVAVVLAESDIPDRRPIAGRGPLGQMVEVFLVPDVQLRRDDGLWWQINRHGDTPSKGAVEQATATRLVRRSS